MAMLPIILFNTTGLSGAGWLVAKYVLVTFIGSMGLLIFMIFFAAYVSGLARDRGREPEISGFDEEAKD